MLRYVRPDQYSGPASSVHNREIATPYLIFREPKLAELLEVEPELAPLGGKASEPEHRVAAYGALTVRDTGDAVRRNADAPGDYARAECIEMLAQRLSGTDGASRVTCFLSMAVDDFFFGRAGTPHQHAVMDYLLAP